MSWDALHSLNADVAQRPIRSLFADPARFDGFSARFDGLLLDYSKTNIDAAIRDALLALADQAMFSVKERGKDSVCGISYETTRSGNRTGNIISHDCQK